MPHNPDDTVHFQSSFVATPHVEASINYNSKFHVPVSFRLYINNLSKVQPGLETSNLLLLCDKVDKMVDRNHSDLTNYETPPLAVTVEGLSFDPAYIEQVNLATKRFLNVLDRYEASDYKVELSKNSINAIQEKLKPTLFKRAYTAVTIAYFIYQLLFGILCGNISQNIQECFHVINEIASIFENEIAPIDNPKD